MLHQGISWVNQRGVSIHRVKWDFMLIYAICSGLSNSRCISDNNHRANIVSIIDRPTVISDCCNLWHSLSRVWSLSRNTCVKTLTWNGY